MNKELKYAFTIHLCKYLGIALVSGSIVHAGTLGGNNTKYIGLIAVGILLTVLGNFLEYESKNIKLGAKLLFLSICLSFGTGMLSGGIQHFSDNPSYSTLLLVVGAIVTFFSLAYKDFPSTMNLKSVFWVFSTCAFLFAFLSVAGANLLSEDHESDHHVETSDGHVH